MHEGGRVGRLTVLQGRLEADLFGGVNRSVVQTVPQSANNPHHVDLPAANRAQAVLCGVASSHIYTANLCTRCGEDFHSFRRDGRKAGRMLSVVGIR